MHPYTNGFFQGYQEGYNQALIHTYLMLQHYYHMQLTNEARSTGDDNYLATSDVDRFSQLFCDEVMIEVDELPSIELQTLPIQQSMTLSLRPDTTKNTTKSTTKTTTKITTKRHRPYRYQCNKCCKTFCSSDSALKHFKKRHDKKDIIKNKIASYCSLQYTASQL